MNDPRELLGGEDFADVRAAAAELHAEHVADLRSLAGTALSLRTIETSELACVASVAFQRAIFLSAVTDDPAFDDMALRLCNGAAELFAAATASAAADGANPRPHTLN